LSDHPLTALEAIMKAGGFNYTTANLKAVKVIRTENGLHKNYIVNLKDVLDGKSDKSFYLQPGDIVYVPERFQMF
jgi:protein involved in polysaccharide export with SLBB domain